MYHYLGVLASVRSLRYKQPDAFWKRPAVYISRSVVVYRFAVRIIAGGADKLRADFFAIQIGRKVSVGAQCSGLLCPQLKAASGKLLVPDKDVDGQVLVGGIGIQDNRCRVVVANLRSLEPAAIAASRPLGR